MPVRRAVRIGVGLAAAVVIFAAGVGVGGGRLYFGMFSSGNTSLPNHLDYSSVNQVYQTIRSQYDGKLTAAQLLDGMKAGLVSSLNDPYSEYFTAVQAKDFNDELNGTFSGIGAELGQNAQKQLVIVAPVAGTPAAKAGLKPQDVITAIDGKTTDGMSIDAAVSAIRGPEGSKVMLTISRAGTSSMQVTITRANIVVPSVTSSILDGNIGYLQITQFSSDTNRLAQAAAQDFANHKVRGVVLDLRDNPGGLVDAAVGVSSLWLPDGATIMQAKRGNTVVGIETANGGDVLHGIPTVVLVNGGTASAAEVTAAALHDNKAATILGEQSFGKGVEQGITDLSGGAELKVTIASWYRPNGQNINHKGITPDVVVKAAAGDAPGGSDAQKAAALAQLTK